MDEWMVKNDPFVKQWKSNFKTSSDERLFDRVQCLGVKQVAGLKRMSEIAPACYLVNPGPSLDKNITELKKIHDKKNSVIICSDVCLYRLIEENIIPDIVCSIDPSEKISTYWEGVTEHTHDIILTCATIVSPSTIKKWKGPFIFFNPTDTHEWKKGFFKKLTKKFSNYGMFLNMGTVAATMFQTAMAINASIIYLVGFDFSSDQNNNPYCKGFMERRVYTDIKTKEDVEKDGAFTDKEYAEIKQKFLDSENAEQFESVRKEFLKKLIEDECKKYNTTKVKFEKTGLELMTNQHLLMYKKIIMNIIPQVKIPVFNCTQGGILTESNCMDLKDSQELMDFDMSIVKGYKGFKQYLF
jgi:hypothetical protein